jgi:transposase
MVPTSAGPTARPLAALIGIDWADAHHDVALQVAGATAIEQTRLAHTPNALAAWLAELAERFAGRPVGIALETSRGPLVHALLAAPFVVLYPVNPRSLQRFREAFAPSGAKDDAPDACLLLELLAKHRDRLAPWVPDDAATRTLRGLVERRRTAVELRTQLTLTLQATLKGYFPQALTWAGTDLTSPLACAFLERWPTLDALQRARPTTVRHFYTTHHCRRAARIDAHLAAMAIATPLTRDPAVLEPSVLFVRLLVGQLRALGPGIAALDAAIAAGFAAHAEAALFAALPGAGPALAPRLLVAFGTDRQRFPAAADLQQCAGIAPVTVRSGQSCHVHWRWSVSTFLRQTFHEFAHHSILHCPWARAFYHTQRAHGKTHHVAVRALAFKWIRILWRCWQERTPYDDARYARALAHRGSPLAAMLAPTAAAA